MMSKRSSTNGSRSLIARPAVVEAFEERVLFATFVVTTTADSGGGSLRDAMNKANASSGADTIEFRIGSGAKTISPSSSLPHLRYPTTINATTQPGYSGKPLIEIRGDRAGGGTNGIVLTGGNSTVNGVVVNRFGANGVLVISKGGNTIKNSYIGTDLSGQNAAGNRQKGIILQSSNNTVDKTVISGNTGVGIQFYTSAASNNKLTGSFVGTNAGGTKAIGNGSTGVAVYKAPNNTIGGTSSSQRNIISGNKSNGIVINTSGATGNKILGNYIGTNAAGNAKIPNAHYGVEISEPNNVVGGTAAGSRNVISGNKYTGVVLWLGSGSNNRVQGNYIGTDATGTKKLGNGWRGVDISNGSSNNLIGGASSAERNVISGNDQHGVLVYQGSNNRIQGNYIGLAANGSSALGNSGDGIRLPSARSVTITSNKIGHNGGAGVNATTSSGTRMSGNTIINDTLVNIRQS